MKKIINVSDFEPNWTWLSEEYKDRKDLAWYNYSSRGLSIPKKIPARESIGRGISALRATLNARFSDAILVSHGPRPSMYTGLFAKRIAPETPHLALSFTFTNLPQGKQLSVMRHAYKQPTKFVCYSTMERQLYADYFDIPIESIDMIYWSVNAPTFNQDEPPFEQGRYICALGTEGRDYKTLFAAMKKLPNIKLVVVATAKSIEGIEVPNNVKVVNNIPLSTAFNILAHSEFMVLPLRDKNVTCGHSSIVSSMFFKKSILITNAPTVYDYIENEKTGLFFEPQDVSDLVRKIESLWDNPAGTILMNEAAYQFAHTNCTEKSAFNYFNQFMHSVSNK
jgi:glycosyltransferase involved in cell wall biosynthesis